MIWSVLALLILDENRIKYIGVANMTSFLKSLVDNFDSQCLDEYYQAKLNRAKNGVEKEAILYTQSLLSPTEYEKESDELG